MSLDSLKSRCAESPDACGALAKSRDVHDERMAQSGEPAESTSETSRDASGVVAGICEPRDHRDEGPSESPALRVVGGMGKGARSDDQSLPREGSTRLRLDAMRGCDVVRLLNSTPLGAVICDRQLYRHRQRSGFRFNDGKRVNLLRYVAWLVDERERRTEAAERPMNPDVPVSRKGVMNLLKAQGFRCALSGRLLRPGTAALDHRLAISRGGKHVMENAQVLDKEVNRAKGTLTNEEFIKLCREVAGATRSRATSTASQS